MLVTNCSDKRTIGMENTEAELAKYIRRAIGSRSIVDFCRESGLSNSYISRLLNGRLDSLPTVRTLAKIFGSSEESDKKKLFEKALKICNYDINKESVQQHLQIVERANQLLTEERQDVMKKNYNSLTLKAQAVGLVLSRLLELGVSLKPVTGLDPDKDFIFRVEGVPYERIITISGFTGNSGQEVMSERDMLAKLLNHVSKHNKAPVLYLVLTDGKDVFDYMAGVMKQLDAEYYILQAASDCKSFVNQVVHTVKGYIPFLFVKS